jgi:TonB family protein
MVGLFGNGTSEGTQGVPTGNASYGKTSGVGGWASFDLGGRSIGSGGLIKPNYSVDDSGTVVVDILVNAKGDVVEATIGKGTNTPNTNLRNEALRAAKRTKFNAVSAVINQKGTITYKFNLN